MFRSKTASLIKNNKRKTVGVFLPYLSGYYLGEISACLRKQALKRNLDLIFIMTNGFGQYDDRIALNYIDMAYIVLDSVSHAFVQELINLDIPIVSTTEDYFPLEVEAVVSDQHSGVQQAFEHLIHLGHKDIGFVGNLNYIDFRLRYESLLENYEERQMQFVKDWLYEVPDSSMISGTLAAEEYLRRQHKCSALLISSDLLAIGFEQTLSKVGYRIPEDVAVIGVDNTSLGRENVHGLSSIDQNLEIIVAAGLDRLEDLSNGGAFQAQAISISQTLQLRRSCGYDADWTASAEDERQAEHMFDNDESAMALAISGLGYEWINNISKLWGPFFNWGIMAHWTANDASLKKRKLCFDNLFSDAIGENELAFDLDPLIQPEDYPPKNITVSPMPEPALITILPIAPEGVKWGVLAIVDTLHKDINQAEYKMFNYYINLMTFYMQRDALADSMREREKSARELAERLEVVANTSNDGIWTWDLETNVVEWNNRLLEMLGFTAKKEINTYRNMAFLERVHKQDQRYVRNKIKEHLNDGKPFNAKYRIKAKNGHYLWVEASGEAIREPGGHISRFIGALTDITEQRLSKQKIEFMAYHDGLTGLANRITLIDKLNRHIKESPGEPLAVMLMDLNRFKMVNDSYGHEAGDALLKHVARAARSALRRSDTLARFGGDEFVFMCAIDNESTALVLAERILKNINGHFTHSDIEIAVQGSIGIALYPRDGAKAEELIKKADIAMYKCKSERHEHAVIYSKEMDVDLKHKMEMENRLRKSIDENELYIVLQPQIESQTGRLMGCEALARWRSKIHGPIPPSVFIPLAEEVGFIRTIGDWVFNSCIELLEKWSETHPDIKMSLNISTGQLQKTKFAEEIIEVIHSRKIAPESLTLEITESAAFNDIDNSHIQLKKLVDAGIQISLDDFGTGYSSLSLLSDLPLQWVKIDRSFVASVSEKDATGGMVKSITDMCHSLNYKVVAEGVETELQNSVVTQVGCDVIQGYYHSKPIEVEKFERIYLTTSGKERNLRS